MKVLEIYESIQGELPSIGKPVTIVRLAGCNLCCTYCDADLTVTPVDMSIDSIIDQCIELANTQVLITGGEPLLQYQAVRDLCTKLAKEFDIFMETNGTIKIDTIPYVTYVMDVKLDEGNSYIEEIRNLQVLNRGDAIKFVYWDLDSYERAWQFIHDHIDPYHSTMIIFSPVDKEHPFVNDFVQRCKNYPDVDIRMQIQIHKYLNAA